MPHEPQPKCSISSDRKQVTVTLPYLNPFREHKQSLQVFILADGETNDVEISGSGEGWSVRWVPLGPPRQPLSVMLSFWFLTFSVAGILPITIASSMHKAALQGKDVLSPLRVLAWLGIAAGAATGLSLIIYSGTIRGGRRAAMEHAAMGQEI